MTDGDRLRLRGRVKVSEAFVAHAYQDSLGYLTIGYGRLIDERKGGGITRTEAEYLLGHDLQAAELACESMPAYLDLSPPRQAVLIEMCFNLGATGLKSFKRMFAALMQQDYERAAAEMLDSKWRNDVKGRALPLAQQMRTGQWTGS